MSVRNLGKKTLAFGFLICIVFSISLVALSGCETPEYKKYEGLGTYEGLDAKTELEIIKFYAGEYFEGQKTVSEWSFDCYYGIYNGYVIYRLRGWDFEALPQIYEVIGDLTFIYAENSTQISIWKNNKEYSLSELYDKGKLSRKNLEKLHARYKEIHRYRYGDFDEHEDLTGLGNYEGLDAETELKIIKMVYDTNYNGQESVDAWNFCDYYHGVYDGYVVYRYTDVYWGNLGEIIDDLYFANGVRTVAWKDGRIWRLKDLYEKELISKEVLEEIFIKHKELHMWLYSLD